MNEQPGSRRILVIGVGNSLRGDDALGPIVARRLAAESRQPAVDVLVRESLTPDVAAELSTAALAVFVDASLTGPRGEVVCRPVGPQSPPPAALLHQCRPPDLLALCRQLYGHQPAAFLVTVRGESFDLADGRLTPPVAAAVEPMCERVWQLIASHPAAA